MSERDGGTPHWTGEVLGRLRLHRVFWKERLRSGKVRKKPWEGGVTVEGVSLYLLT